MGFRRHLQTLREWQTLKWGPCHQPTLPPGASSWVWQGDVGRGLEEKQGELARRYSHFAGSLERRGGGLQRDPLVVRFADVTVVP